MKLGKYRITVTRTTEVQITVADLALFQEDFQRWKELGNPGDEVTEDEFLAARAIMSISGHGSEKYNRGLTIIHLHSDQETEYLRTCRHCGCTDHDACRLDAGPCDWHDTLDCCTNPDCVAAEAAMYSGSPMPPKMGDWFFTAY